MKTKLLAATAALTLSACGLPAAIAIPASLIAAPTVDRITNAATGGKIGYTISGEAGERRNAGDKLAAAQCGAYTLGLGWYDAFAFSPASHAVFEARNADHCEKWRLVDSGELEGLKRPLPPVPAPVDAKDGLRIVR